MGKILPRGQSSRFSNKDYFAKFQPPKHILGGFFVIFATIIILNLFKTFAFFSLNKFVFDK